jgi:Dolichyl-phosphate-mannose-protein mannosyltransferase
VRRSRFSEHLPATLAGTGAILLALGFALPLVWWQALSVDEATTLEYATRRFTAIAHDTFVDRGGGPLYFYLEHVTLAWPGGLEGLRLPAVAFLVPAVTAAWFLARDLTGPAHAAGVVLLLAAAPLTVSLGAFARPYTVLLAFATLAAWLSVRATGEPSRGRWILAGAVAGGLYLVHPIAPLYSVLAFLTGPIASERPLRRAARAAAPGAVAFAVALAPYLWALAVLGRRYDVGSRGEGSAGRGLSVPREAVEALAPTGWVAVLVFLVAAFAGLALLLRRQTRLGLALGAWLVVPVIFFAAVPVGSTRFHGRYLLPALPEFLLLVVAACLALPRPERFGRLLPAGAVAALLAWCLVDDVARLREARALRLPELAAAVRSLPADSVMFASTGPGPPGRPAELLDTYLDLSLDGLRLTDELPAVDPRYAPNLVERGTAEVTEFLRSADHPASGIWVFALPRDAVADRSGPPVALPGTRARVVGDRYVVVWSDGPASPGQLVRTGALVRREWAAAYGGELVRRIVLVDARALEGAGR